MGVRFFHPPQPLIHETNAMNKLILAAMPLLGTSLLAQGTSEAAEPNNTTATAAVLAAGAQGFGDIDSSGTDEDWFKVTLAAAGDLKVWAGPGFAGQIGDTRIRVLAADGVTQLVDVDDGNTTTHGFYTTFVQTGLAAGDYYVAVRGYDNTTFGSYTLDVAYAAPGVYSPVTPPLTPMVEGAENNDPRVAFGSGTATATVAFSENAGFTDVPAPTAGSGTGDATVGKDYDFYAVVLGTGSHVFRTTRSALATAPVINDTVLRLYDGALTSIAVNDDFSGAFSQITYNVTTPGTYYLCVSGYYGGTSTTPSTGNYLLDILAPTPALPVGVATTTIQTGGCAGSAGTPALGNRLSSTGTNVRTERAIQGTASYLDGTSLPAFAPILRVIGLLPLAVPFDLTGLGAPGCQVEVDPLSVDLAFADATGSYFWGFDVPGGIAFIGLPVEQQLAVLDVPANALGLTVSNRVSSVVGLSH
jgi:hypothetical protein